MVTKRRFLALAVGLALSALSGCVPTENKPAADFQCPTVWHDPMSRVIFENGIYKAVGPDFTPNIALSEAIQNENFWRGAILHGSNEQLDYAVAYGVSEAYGKVNSTWLRQAKTAQSLRRSNNCADVPNFSHWNLL